MQKTLIKSLLAVAVAGTFATFVNAANLPKQVTEYVEDDGTVVPDAIDENFQFLNDRANTLGTRLTDAEDKVTSLGAQVTGLIDGLTTDEANIQNNKDNISQNATNIAANTGRLTTAEGKVTTLEGTVTDHGTRLDGHDTRLMTAEGKVTTLGGKVATLDGKVTTLEGKVTTLEGTVTDHGTRLDGHDTRLTTAEGRIDLNSHAIADNYKEMKNNFAAVNSRIDKLDDKMKKGFASQAALNGLFQPYNVGKFNVSAAIGGYDSEQAMALGAGYRFNKNFAIKAGIASDLGGFDHVTYNVGANFEF